MPFKKLHLDILERLATLEITAPTPFQSSSIPVIKSGANTYCLAPAGSGKTTTLILTVMNALKCKEVGSTPRAVVLVENREKALELYEAFLLYTKKTSLRVYVGYEKLHIDVQKSEVAMGVDILISTPKSMKKLFLLNGVRIAGLKMICVDDAEFLAQIASYQAIMSIAQSVSKCQYVLFSEKMHPTLKRFEDYFMTYAKVVSL